MVTFQLPSRELLNAARAETEELLRAKQERESKSFTKFNYFKLDLPERPRTGDKVSRAIFILPAVDSTKRNYVKRVKRFYKSAKYPKGASISCGYDSLLQKSLDLYRQEHGKPHTFFGGARKYIYQGFPFTVDSNFQLYLDVESCVAPNGAGIAPLVFEATLTMHDAIENIVALVGAGDNLTGHHKCFYPESGIPLLITKKKFGPEMMNIEYSVDRLEAMPLPEAYYPGLENMYDLEAIYPEASIEDQIAIIREHSLPIPPEALELGFGSGTQALGVPRPAIMQAGPKPIGARPLMVEAPATPRPMPAIKPSRVQPPPAQPLVARAPEPVFEEEAEEDGFVGGAQAFDDPATFDPFGALTPEKMERVAKGAKIKAPFKR